MRIDNLCKTPSKSENCKIVWHSILRWVLSVDNIENEGYREDVNCLTSHTLIHWVAGSIVENGAVVMI